MICCRVNFIILNYQGDDKLNILLIVHKWLLWKIVALLNIVGNMYVYNKGKLVFHTLSEP